MTSIEKYQEGTSQVQTTGSSEGVLPPLLSKGIGNPPLGTEREIVAVYDIWLQFERSQKRPLDIARRQASFTQLSSQLSEGAATFLQEETAVIHNGKPLTTGQLIVAVAAQAAHQEQAQRHDTPANNKEEKHPHRSVAPSNPAARRRKQIEFFQPPITSPLPVAQEPSVIEVDPLNEEELLQPGSLADQLRRRLDHLLPESQRQAVSLRLDGKSPTEIAEQLGITPRAVDMRVFYARQKIEEALLSPAGYKRVTSIEDETLRQAVRHHRLPTTLILGVLYTKDAMVGDYQLGLYGPKRRAPIDPDFVSRGYLPLSQNVSQDEYEAIQKPRYQDLLTEHQGRFYITPEKLIEFRGRRSEAVLKKHRFLLPGETTFSDYARTPAEYTRLVRAALNGGLKAEKRKSRWVAAKIDLEQFTLSRFN